jgi:adenylate cyclase
MSEGDLRKQNDQQQHIQNAKNGEIINPTNNAYANNNNTVHLENHHQQRQTILNLYYSGIPEYIIAFQLDINEEDVHKVIQSISTDDDNSVSSSSSSSVQLLEDNFTSSSTPPLDSLVNMDIAIKNAQVRMWKALRSEPEINLSMEHTNDVLRTFAKSKVTLVILHIDLVDSTELSISLPLERLSTILQTFMQEAASVIASYGGYVLKYVGDAVLAFFIKTSIDDESQRSIPNFMYSDNQLNIKDQIKKNFDSFYLPCINAINCGRSIIKILDQAINPILNQYGYPEMAVRVGIDIGENAVIQDGWDIHRLSRLNDKEAERTLIIKEPHFDIVGYSTNLAEKMTGLANPNSIVIGQSVHDMLNHEKYDFKLLNINPEVWKYIDDRTGTAYHIYHGH